MTARFGPEWLGALDALFEAVWLVDEESLSILAANLAAAKLTGIAAQDMAGLSMQRLAATPQDQALWSDGGALARAGVHSHTHVLRRDGVLVPVEQRVQRVASPAGASVLMVTMVDRSEQEASERELETLLSELRATLDSAADGMLVCGMDGSVRAFNQRLAVLWGIPRELLVRRDDDAVRQYMLAQVQDPQTYSARLEAIARDPMLESTDILNLRSGAVIECRSVPQLSRGLPVGRVYSFRDITRQAENQAGLRLAARVFESSLDAIFIADAQHRIMRMNPGCERLVGQPAQVLLGNLAASLFGGSAEPALMDQVLAGWEREGFWEGELWLPRDAGAYCAVHLSWVALRDDSGRIAQSIGFMRDLTLQHAAQKRIEELAFSDVLTGLPNRLMLSQRVDTAIEVARRHGTGFAILFLDLDRFKIINDSLGHPFGDRVLQLVAERLQSCLRQTDMLCRLGGDEFVIYLHGGDATVAENVARRMLEDMLRPFVLDGMGFSIQCSIGMALFPQDGQTLDDLIKQADTAMYRVKERGRGNYGFYQPQMNAGLLSRMQLEHAMRQALANGRLAVHYQPQVCIQTGHVTGAEALMRWTDPEFGVVSPSVFIPLAEESGYIVTLGAWVLEQSVLEAVRWMQAGYPIKLSVNVSALEFRQPDFVQRLTRLLEAEGLPPTLLELELTETILLQDAQEMALRLKALADLGVGLVIDDFGTGYSSLAYLKKLPIHKLKIDQSFVRGLPGDEEDRAIVGAIVNMGRALRIEVVAEGVETEAQRAALAQMQCHHYQGFLCAPGLAAEAFRRLLVTQGVDVPANLPAPPRGGAQALKPFHNM
ncbi:putative bifunctional diguanylate cyclase/phosphodiesterase [Paenacidovorax monticola]|uniref:EAL domain-containing protein n=1 Tax=Paenacidovorax monticola TaxID=1926868 RepID=A0A7H0HGB9_9BURK|nr:bifunctional diguanylate cyclase/phosphodiesterase [Paenacidovorax monticola]QNP59585.1 EAL domain-containing protein [Paenacidovorax monticola]